MDALKAMKEEIERKKRQLQDKNLVGPEKKYFKREDLIKKDEEEYRERILATRGTTDAHESSNANQSDGASTNTIDGQEKQPERILNRKEVIRRLRERGEPVKLFGESEVCLI